MFGKKKRERARINQFNAQLIRLTQTVHLIETNQNDNSSHTPYDVIHQVQMISYIVFDTIKNKDYHPAEQIMVNSAECFLQLVILTLLCVDDVKPPKFEQIKNVIENNYPVAQLNSKFEFKNDVLTLERLRLMDILQVTLTPQEVVLALHKYVLDSMDLYIKIGE